MRQAREFESLLAAEEWVQATFASWRTSLSTAELEALSAYKGSEYGKINGALRGTRDWNERVERLVDSLDRAIARMRLPEPVIAYRGVGIPSLAAYAGDLTGAVIEEHGYVSTSLLRDTAQTFLEEVVPAEHGVLERIYLPGGTQVAVETAAPDLVTDLGECELLLPHGTLLRVTADHGTAQTYRSIDVEVTVQ